MSEVQPTTISEEWRYLLVAHRGSPDNDTLALALADALMECDRGDESEEVRREVRVRQAAREIMPGQPYFVFSLSQWLKAPDTTSIIGELMGVRNCHQKGNSALFDDRSTLVVHPDICERFLAFVELKSAVRFAYGRTLVDVSQVNDMMRQCGLPTIHGDSRIEGEYAVWFGVLDSRTEGQAK